MFLLVYPRVFDGVGGASPPPEDGGGIDSFDGSLYMTFLIMYCGLMFPES
jgi:hypothetical protein